MMTRKHFVQFAEIVRTTPGLVEDTSFMSKLVGVLGENPRFDVTRFFEASGYEIPPLPDLDFCVRCREHTGFEFDFEAEEWLSVCCTARAYQNE